MAVVPFHKFYPQLAEDERRSIHLVDESEGKVGFSPDGAYVFSESYCDDPDCDCRRVMLNVYHAEEKRYLAVIGFAFDPGDDMRGPFLDRLNPQSEHAEQVLQLTRDVLLADANYVARLERHYNMVKEAVKNRRKEQDASLPWWKRKRKKPKKRQVGWDR